MNVLYYLTWVAVALLPAAIFLAAARAFDWWTRGGSSRGALFAGAAPPAGPPIERLVGDLRRLEQDYTRIERSDLPRRSVRLEGVRLAYDDTLCACCAALGIAPSGRAPLDPVQRLQIEATLAQHGLTW